MTPPPSGPAAHAAQPTPDLDAYTCRVQAIIVEYRRRWRALEADLASRGLTYWSCRPEDRSPFHALEAWYRDEHSAAIVARDNPAQAPRLCRECGGMIAPTGKQGRPASRCAACRGASARNRTAREHQAGDSPARS